MTVFVEGVANFLAAHEELNLRNFFLVQGAFGLEFFNLLESLLLAAGNFKGILVAPDYAGLCFDSGFLEHLIEVDYLVDASVSDDEEK